MHILVLHQAVSNARADEVDTLVQAEEIKVHLHILGHTVSHAEITSLGELESVLECNQPDCVFNLVESFHGSDRFAYLIPGLLETLHIPYTGNSALPMQFVSDKLKLKTLLSACGVRVPRGLEAGEKSLYIVKSAQEHASLGMDAGSVVKGTTAAQKLITVKTAHYGGEWLAEEFIEGREFNLSLLGNGNSFTILPPAEIQFESFPENMPHIVDYTAKWDETSYAYHHTPRRFTEITDAMEAIASKVWMALGLNGYARIDLRMDADGRLWVIDINPNPCLAADAGFMAAAQQIGLPPPVVIQTILEHTDHAHKQTSYLAA